MWPKFRSFSLGRIGMFDLLQPHKQGKMLRWQTHLGKVEVTISPTELHHRFVNSGTLLSSKEQQGPEF